MLAAMRKAVVSNASSAVAEILEKRRIDELAFGPKFAVTVAGGSIGGLCAGIILRGIGCEVDIHERVAGPMEMHGAGIVVQEKCSV
jgi:hypothetical protein